MFRFAVANGTVTADPTYALMDALIRPIAKLRAVIVDPKEGALMRAIDKFHGQTVTKLALQLGALLAPRPGELRKAKWTEFDLEGAVWSVPAIRMKMRRAHRVPLAKQSLEYLAELTRITGNSEFVLPSLVSSVSDVSAHGAV